MKTIALLVLALCMSGCVATSHLGASIVPKRDASSYRAPDGRVWVRHDSMVAKDGSVSLAFTPTPVKPGEWSEMLLFTWNSTRLALNTSRVQMESARRDFDADATFSYVGSDSAYIQYYHFPRWKECGVSKVVKGDNLRYTAIAYQNRLGHVDSAAPKRWRRFLENLPNRKLLEAQGDALCSPTGPEVRHRGPASKR